MDVSNSTHAHSSYLTCMRFIQINTVREMTLCCDTIYSVIVTKVIVSDCALLEFFMWVVGIFMVMWRCQANGSI